MSRTLELPTPQATDAFGRRLGAVLVAGDVVLLAGDLGAGKTALTKGIVRSIDGVLDLDFESGGTPVWQPAGTLGLNDIGRVRVALATPLPVDSYREHRATGAFILVDEADGWTLGAGMAGTTAIHAGTSDDAVPASSAASSGGAPTQG